MVKWIYDHYFLEGKETLFIVSIIVLLIMIIVTFFLVRHELKEEKNAHK